MRRELIQVSGARWWAAGVAVLAAAVGLLTLGPGAARADLGPESTYPTSGAVLDVVPPVVTLTFALDVDEARSHVAVLDSTGRDAGDGEPKRAAPTVLRLPVGGHATGDYTVAYHVTFIDGTTDTGLHRFSVGTGVPPAPLDDATRRAGTDAVATHTHRIDTFSATLLVIDGAVLAAVLALLWLKPRDGRSASLRADPRF
ncbi:copper resistance protein CopC [Micromonospora sp. HNM0581]|uniref:copper resistance CopC family protein n=1 Tax=Micromonospora sp. HNM0581 TaxID=2716341 RepID=UPI00146DD22C|nr:copper resistance CopC family protein [Micromonospora sp. HNM0581]NLU79165.1 copper resistance protein CopC [Micromonospora sp. HNM0581]